MPLATLHYRSALLGKAVGMTAILPTQGQPPYATLYLLHGLSDDHTQWQRRTRIEAYAEKHPIAVVMPDGFRHWYTDNERGRPYGRYTAEEVVATAERYFPLDPRPAKRSIGGLSMGGYGAVRTALAYPGRFASAHSHSGALDHGRMSPGRAKGNIDVEEFRAVFGDAPAGTDHDVVALARKRVEAGDPLPELLIDCGTEDFLIDDNRRVHAELESIGVPHEYREHPGAHDWDYWDEHVRDALAFHADAMGA